MLLLTSAAGAFALATAVACTPTGAGCTLVGAEPAVTFDFSSVAGRADAESLRATTCVAGECRDHSPVPDFLVHETALTGGPVAVSLTIHAADGKQLFDAVTTVTPDKFEPNGPECAPSVWQVAVVTAGHNRLTRIAPSQ